MKSSDWSRNNCGARVSFPTPLYSQLTLRVYAAMYSVYMLRQEIWFHSTWFDKCSIPINFDVIRLSSTVVVNVLINVSPWS